MSTEWDWMRRAVDLGKQCVPEPEREDRPPPKVGVVIAKGDVLIGESFRGQFRSGDHAEFGLLEQLMDQDLAGTTVFTTLEPCSRRHPPKLPCAQRLADRGVSAVFIGMYDPNPRIYREGWRLLRDKGVLLRDFPPDLRAEIQADNDRFVGQFRLARGDWGTASFDYRQNRGRFDIASETAGIFETRWTQAGQGSIHALNDEHHVGHARYATKFDEIDDPGALDFSNYSVTGKEGEIVTFPNGTGYVLIKVAKVYAGHDYGDDRTELQIEFEVRRPVSTHTREEGSENDASP